MEWKTMIKLGMELIYRGCKKAKQQEGFYPCGFCPFEEICNGIPENWEIGDEDYDMGKEC